MNGIVIGVIGVCTLLFLICMGLPIIFSLGLVGFCGLWALRGFIPAVTLLASGVYERCTNYVFLAVPLFMWLGFLCASSGISNKMFNCLSMWLGKLRGGLGMATAVGCAAFGTINGSTLVTATVFAKVGGPEMRRRGYNKYVAYGICASSGLIGQLIPPSNFMVNYGVITGDSVGRLLMAGISPGLVLTLFFCISIGIIALVKPEYAPKSEEASYSLKEKIISLKGLTPVAIIGGTVIAGISTGVFSVSESAAIAAAAITLIALFQKRPFKDFMTAGKDAITATAMATPLIACGMTFARFLSLSGLVGVMTSTIANMNISPTTFLFLTRCEIGEDIFAGGCPLYPTLV